MCVASSHFHRPYVYFAYIDMREALTLALKTLSGGKCTDTVRLRSFVTPTYYAYECAATI